MALWELSSGQLNLVPPTSYGVVGLRERYDLQAVLRDNIDALAPDLLVISEEFSDWEGERLRIDLLAIDRTGSLVVIELKRTDSGGESELQALRYAALVSTMTFERAVACYATYLEKRGRSADAVGAEAALLEFLGLEAPDEATFGQDVRIVLAAANFSKSLTSTVLWLRERNVDIRCVRMVPHQLGSDLSSRVLINFEQIIPVPEASEYQVQFARKEQRRREERTMVRDLRRFDLRVQGHEYQNVAKSRAAYLVVAALVRELGVRPERIATETTEGPKRSKSKTPLFLRADGELDEDAFGASVAEILPDWRRRYYAAEGELLSVAGSTYAFNSGWNGLQVEELIRELRALHPDLSAEYTETPSTDG